MKVGRSEQARAGTVSHTASLAGSDAASDAFLRRLGIARVDSIPSFLETLKLLHVGGPLDGCDISSMSCSGGEASVMADSAEGRRVRFRPLAADHQARVKATLGPLVAVANPLDYHTFIWNDEPAMTATFTAMVSGGFDLNMLVLDFPRADRCSDADWCATLNAFEAALKANTAKGAIVASLPENMSEAWTADIMARGIVPMQGIDEALDATEAAAIIGEAWERPAPLPVATAAPDTAKPEHWMRLPPRRCLPGSACRFRTGNARKRPTKRSLPQMPSVIRLSSRRSASPTSPSMAPSGSTCDDADAVREAATALSAIGTGLYVERMVDGGIAELIVGITHDPLFGPVMTVGSGGVLVELLEDSRTLLLPASREDIVVAIRSLKLFPLLDGYRGRPKADIEAAIDAIESIARFAVENSGHLIEMDINPLIVCENGKGAAIADALIVTREETQ